MEDRNGLFHSLHTVSNVPSGKQILWQYLLQKQSNRDLYVRYNRLSSRFHLPLKQKQIAAINGVKEKQ